MLGRIRQAIRRSPAAHAPNGVRLYAVGDIHGRLDLFDELLRRIEADHAAAPPAAAEIICLGDYIDRGPQSAQLLDRLLAGPPPWATWTHLRGNHEQVLLDIFDEPMREARDSGIAQWLRFGGVDTLLSYGAGPAVAAGGDPWATADFMHGHISRAHRALLRAMPLSARRGDYLFVHAGIRPGRAFDDQCADDLLWIREEFLDCPDDFGAVVVHGHSIRSAPELRPNRIGIDTGAYQSGVLTALVLDGAERRLIATG